MEIINLNNYEEKNYETGVALGNFDGVHIGHQCLLKDMIAKAREKGLKTSVLLFENHTKTILENNGNNKLYILTSNEQKLEILKNIGIDIVYTINFDENLMKLSGEEFVEKIIVKKLNAELVTVGFDYRFGYKALGNSDYLKKLGLEKGFDTNIISPIYIDKEVVSSTLIRNLIRTGNIKKANQLLGRHYIVNGTVITGKNRGNKIGYPTANIRLNYNYTIPKTGVYKTITLVSGKEYLSITDIGYNPTFNENELKIENHILNFNNNIYDQTIEVKFIAFIRDDIKFDNVRELTNQIEKDIAYVKNRQ